MKSLITHITPALFQVLSRAAFSVCAFMGLNPVLPSGRQYALIS